MRSSAPLDGSIAHLARPPATAAAGGPQAVVICPDFPRTTGLARAAVQSLAVLADRIASDVQWLALAMEPRGLAGAPGDFSISGWIEDGRSAVEELRAEGARRVFVAGLGLGGVVALAVAAADSEVGGAAALATPADLSSWAGDPRKFLEHARAVGLIQSSKFPVDPDRWQRELREIRPLDLASQVSPRPTLVLHGSDDEVVPDLDARALADSCGPNAELRLVAGAGHQLRNDPRAVAILLGWLSRQ